ncbi:hypothetical protein D3C80_1541450 [compost metagenome]
MAISADSSAPFVTIRPARTSLWPPRYLVALWTIISAPSSSGRWKNGVSSVLSTIVSSPCRRAHVHTAAISVIIMSGLVGVSMNTAFVFGRRAASRPSRSLVST